MSRDSAQSPGTDQSNPTIMITINNNLEVDPSVFTGNDGHERAEWILSIQGEAFTQGKTNDSAWIAALASTRIGGQALRWYSQQSEDIMKDWIRLRVALLDRYPASSGLEPSAAPAWVVSVLVLFTLHVINDLLQRSGLLGATESSRRISRYRLSPKTAILPVALTRAVTLGLSRPTLMDGRIKVQCTSSRCHPPPDG